MVQLKSPQKKGDFAGFSPWRWLYCGGQIAEKRFIGRINQ
jgi:hypothetical protein